MQESLDIEIFGFDKRGFERFFTLLLAIHIGELGTGTKVFSSGSLVLPLKPAM